jgi:hypothetical protein
MLVAGMSLGITVLCALIIVPAVSLDLRLGPSSVSPEAVAVPVVLDVVPEEPVTSLQADVLFPANELEFYQAFPGEAASFAGKNVAVALIGESALRLIVAGFNQTIMPSGVVAELYFVPRGEGSIPPLALANAVFSGPEGDTVNPFEPDPPQDDPPADDPPSDPGNDDPEDDPPATQEGESNPDPVNPEGESAPQDPVEEDGGSKDQEDDAGDNVGTNGRTLLGGGVPGGFGNDSDGILGGARGGGDATNSRGANIGAGSAGSGAGQSGGIYSVNWTSGANPDVVPGRPLPQSARSPAGRVNNPVSSGNGSSGARQPAPSQSDARQPQGLETAPTVNRDRDANDFGRTRLAMANPRSAQPQGKEANSDGAVAAGSSGTGGSGGVLPLALVGAVIAILVLLFIMRGRVQRALRS